MNRSRQCGQRVLEAKKRVDRATESYTDNVPYRAKHLRDALVQSRLALSELREADRDLVRWQQHTQSALGTGLSTMCLIFVRPKHGLSELADL